MSKSHTTAQDEQSAAPIITAQSTPSTTSKQSHQQEPPQEENWILKILQFIFVSIAIIGAMIYLNPTTVTPSAFDLPQPPSVALSYELDLAEPIFRGLRRLKGPESIAIHPTNGFLYSGTQDGRIVRARLDKPYNSSPETLGVLGNPNAALPLPCGTYTTESICGRPLGMEMTLSKKGEDVLFFADAYLGIAQYNTNVHELTMLVKGGFTPTNGPTISKPFFNDVAYDKVANVLYFTITSTKFELNNLFFELLDGGANGMLCKYDFSTEKVTIVTKNIAFANGIVIHPTKRIALVSELGRARILAVNIDPKVKSKYGQYTIFADNLPVLPDNLALVGDDEIWTAGVNLRVKSITNKDETDPSKFPGFFGFSLYDILAGLPKVRLFLAKALPGAYTSYLTRATPSGVVRIDLNSGKVIKLMTPSAGHRNANIQGIGRSAASITPHQSKELPKGYIHIYMGGFSPETTSIGRFTWDLKKKMVVQSTNPTTNDEIRVAYRNSFEGVQNENPVEDYYPSFGSGKNSE